MLATIGYEKSTPEDFIATLGGLEIEVLIDIRERAQSRRRGFSKKALALALERAGIEYIHIPALGDPKEGREAARSGRMELFKKIFSNVLSGGPAQEALAYVEELAKHKRICLMCYERNHHDCHRKIVSDQLEKNLDVEIQHLGVVNYGAKKIDGGPMFYPHQGATA